jgi:uncharacterized C2H2 Zn-finger protein
MQTPNAEREMDWSDRPADARSGTPDPEDELEPAPGDLRCAHCEAAFDSTDDLDAHLRQAHSLPRVALARCPECRAEFGTEDELAGHRREAHGAPV